MSLFNEHLFWKELREHSDPKKRNLIHKYEAMFGSLEDVDVRQTRFYKNHLSKFDFPFRANIPKDLVDDFDWDILKRLIAGSFSSKMTLKVNKEWLENPVDDILVDVHVKVWSGNQEIERTLDELWSFQILRLFEIYIEEQMGILVTAHEDNDNEGENDDTESAECDVSKLQPVTTDDDGVFLEEERNVLIQKFNQQIESVHKEIEKNRLEKEAAKEEEILKLILDRLQELNDSYSKQQDV